MGATPAQKAKFGKALQSRVTTKADRIDLAHALGLESDETVRNWTTGARAPDPDVVFAIERHLEMSPGSLSRHLGFVPEITVVSMSVPEAIAADPFLTFEGRRILEAAYEAAAEPVRASVESSLRVVTAVGESVRKAGVELRTAARTGKTKRKPSKAAARPRSGAVKPEEGG